MFQTIAGAPKANSKRKASSSAGPKAKAKAGGNAVDITITAGGADILGNLVRSRMAATAAASVGASALLSGIV